MDPTAEQDVTGLVPEELARAIRETAGEIAALLRSASDTSVRVPGLEWTVGEMAADLALANEFMADLAAGWSALTDGTPRSLAAANARSLEAFGERRPEPLAAVIAEQAEVFLAGARRAAAS